MLIFVLVFGKLSFACSTVVQRSAIVCGIVCEVPVLNLRPAAGRMRNLRESAVTAETARKMGGPVYQGMFSGASVKFAADCPLEAAFAEFSGRCGGGQQAKGARPTEGKFSGSSAEFVVDCQPEADRSLQEAQPYHFV